MSSDDNKMFYARMHLMISSNSNEPFRFDFRNANKTLPGKYLADFIKALGDINPKMLHESNDLNEKCLKFYKDNSEATAN